MFGAWGLGLRLDSGFGLHAPEKAVGIMVIVMIIQFPSTPRKHPIHWRIYDLTSRPILN